MKEEEMQIEKKTLGWSVIGAKRREEEVSKQRSGDENGWVK